MKAQLLTVVLLLFPVPLWAGDFENGFIAATFGDWATAHRLWQPLAEEGDARAQYHLGILYDDGKGVRRDHQKALGWYYKAAQQCHAGAQRNLELLMAESPSVFEKQASDHGGDGIVYDNAKATQQRLNDYACAK
ncbi:tetratricopeptide repeat protein [Halomonas sp. WWR20]